MSKRQYIRLKTTTGEYLEIGTRIRQKGTPHFGIPMRIIEGAITKMEECDSGIFLHIKKDDGTVDKAHVRYYIPLGVNMCDCGIETTILKRTPRQMEIAA